MIEIYVYCDFEHNPNEFEPILKVLIQPSDKQRKLKKMKFKFIFILWSDQYTQTQTNIDVLNTVS